MTSDRKREANRRNAKRSTGPRTPEGKARASQNARRHGLHTDLDRHDILSWLNVLTDGNDPAVSDIPDDELSAATWSYAMAEARLSRAIHAERSMLAKLAEYLASKDLETPLDLETVDQEALICLLAFHEFDVTKDQLALLNARALPKLNGLRRDVERLHSYRAKAERERGRRFRAWRRARAKIGKTKPNTSYGCKGADSQI